MANKEKDKKNRVLIERGKNFQEVAKAHLDLSFHICLLLCSIIFLLCVPWFYVKNKTIKHLSNQLSFNVCVHIFVYRLFKYAMENSDTELGEL